MSRYGRDGDCRIHLKRDNYNVAWGFRLQGGRDVGTPLTVQRVFSGSPADGQLQRGDIVLTVDDRDVSNFDLNQVQNLIKSTGAALSFIVRRSKEVVNDTSPVKQPSPLQQPSFATSDARSFGQQSTIKSQPEFGVSVGVTHQYQDNDGAGRANYNQQPTRFESEQNVNTFHSSGYNTEQSYQKPVQQPHQVPAYQPNVYQAPLHNQAPVHNQEEDFQESIHYQAQVQHAPNRQSTVHRATVSQTAVHHQTPSPRPPQFTANQSIQNQDAYRSQEYHQPASEQYHDRGSYNTPPMTRSNATQSGGQQQKWSDQQQYLAQEKDWYIDQQASSNQFDSNNQQGSYQGSNQGDEEEEHTKSIGEIKQMFSKQSMPTPNKPIKPMHRPNMQAQNRATQRAPPGPPPPGPPPPTTQPTSVRKTPPYQQKSSYNPLEFVGVTGPKPKITSNPPPGSIQRGPPPSSAPQHHGASQPDTTGDPVMDFYLHGFDSKHGPPPEIIKFNGTQHQQSSPKPGGYGGHLLPPRTIPTSKKPAAVKKQDFNPAQSAVLRMLQEEESRGPGEPEPPEPANQSHPKQPQHQPRKMAMGNQPKNSTGSSLQMLLERDQAQLAQYQESEREEPSYKTQHQTIPSRGSSAPQRIAESSSYRGGFESAPQATHNRPYDQQHASYQQTQDNYYSNAGNFYGDGYGGGENYPVTNF